jgi:hypothetical protein
MTTAPVETTAAATTKQQKYHQKNQQRKLFLEKNPALVDCALQICRFFVGFIDAHALQATQHLTTQPQNVKVLVINLEKGRTREGENTSFKD